MTESLEDLKLIELWVNNVKKIRAVRVKLKPTGITRVVGTNGAGKTSLVDSLQYLIDGAESHPSEVIRRGEDSAEVVGDLGTVIVTRDWKKERGTKLTIRPKDGTQIVGGAQAWLDQRRGALSFDASAFMRMDKKKQVEIYKQLVGADTIAIEAEYKTAFDLRTGVSAKGKEMAAQYKAMPEPAADLPDVPVSVADLLAAQARLLATKAENDKFRAEVSVCSRNLDQEKANVRSKADALAALEASVNAARAALTKANDDEAAVRIRRDRAEAVVAELFDPDLAPINAQISGAAAVNAAVAAKAARSKLWGELEAKRAEKLALDAKLETLLAAKEKLLKNAKVPVPGLGFNSEGLTLGGFPIEEASEAERTIAVAAIGFAQNPKLRFITLKNGNDIDDAGMAKLAAMAERVNAQIIIERMAHDDAECVILVEDEDTILIRDGEASGKLAQDTEPAAPEAVLTIKPPAESPPKLALVPPPPPSAPKEEKKKGGPTFKKKPIADLSGEELTAAITEVNKSIDANPLAPKSTAARAKLEDLKAELNARLELALGGPPQTGEGRQPGEEG
jgi:ABC-type dipeptide/oligopeptide/nickel transport system ATPase component